MSTDRIVVISGKQGSGKSTLVEFLESIHPKTHVNEFKFADTIYAIHNFAREKLKLLGIEIPKDLETKDGKMLQWLGTEWGRETFGQDVWIRCAQGDVKSFFSLYSQKPKLAIISDCRFKNEFEAFPEALRVRLECDKLVRKDRCSQWRTNDTHPSEVDLDDHVNKFDMVFDTRKEMPRNIAQLVKAQLDKNTWLEKRK